ncbi:MAG: hypothetical protein R3E83_06500 [Burkholderiaceae bacterium]
MIRESAPRTTFSQMAAMPADAHGENDASDRLGAQARWLREASMGHPGPGGRRLAGATPTLAAIIVALFSGHLRQDAATPNWPNRDRCQFAHGRADGLLRLLAAHGIHRLPPPPARHLMRSMPAQSGGRIRSAHDGASALRNAVAKARVAHELATTLGAEAAALADFRSYLIADRSGIDWARDESVLIEAGRLALRSLIIMVDESSGAQVEAYSHALQMLAHFGWQIREVDAADDILELGRQLALARHGASGPTLIRCRTDGLDTDAGTILRAIAGHQRPGPAEVARFWNLDRLGQKRVQRWRRALDRLRDHDPAQADALLRALSRLDLPTQSERPAPRSVRAIRAVSYQ